MSIEPLSGHRVVEENRSGYWLQVGNAASGYRAFVPKALPPAPSLLLTAADQELAGRADRALGRLDGVADILPDVSLYLSVWLYREAVYSSQIEGTQSSLSDLLMFEVEGIAEAVDDVRETANYVGAALEAIGDLETLPLSMRLLCRAHERLLASGRGSEKQPGEVRTSQNWIGGTRPGTARFVPPPPEYLPQVIGDLERFLNDLPEPTPLLVKAALAHAQFETIHPFLDGNGRVGRLLIVLMLQSAGALRRPLLYLSWFFKQHRDEYYRLLQNVRTTGDWESWVRFFLDAVESTADEAVKSARAALELFRRDETRIRARKGKGLASVLQVFAALQQSPITDVRAIATKTGVSNPTAHAAIRKLEAAGIVRELTGRRRNKMFGYDAYLQLLHADDKP